ncbi:hypothetical protein APR08_000525 [Nocardia amikacinitolerans]|nr:hypothetical protein [Nocardia amikacinitolerans]
MGLRRLWLVLTAVLVWVSPIGGLQPVNAAVVAPLARFGVCALKSNG